MQSSKHQEAIYNFIRSGSGSAVIEAVAGGGKTTTIVEAAKLIPSSLSCTFVAFNKGIAEELQRRLPGHVQTKTLNGLGFSAWIKSQRAGNGRMLVEAKKTYKLMDDILSEAERRLYSGGLVKLVALAKSIGLVPSGVKDASPLTRDTDEAWFDLIEKYDVEFEEKAVTEDGIELARSVLRKSIEVADRFIDFDDQLYMPVIMCSRFWQNDFLFVDEAQDVNQVQRAMLKRALKPGGRLIAVGDPYQAIYGFRGADTESIANIKSEFAAISLPLSVSYRCPQAVVREAQKLVPHIQPAPTAEAGSVATVGDGWNSKTFDPEDAIICRNTKPLVATAYHLLRAGVAVRVLGREIGQGLVALIKKMNARSIEQLESKLAEHGERETAKFMAKGQEQKADALNDRIETVLIFLEQLPEGSRTIENLIKKIEALFTDNNRGVLTLCTIHKAKGLEWDRVFLLDRNLMPSKWARQAWQKDQEVNLEYVAITRAKRDLRFIESKKQNGER